MSYEEDSAKSFYADEISVIHDAITKAKPLEDLSGEGYIESAEIKLGRAGEQFATVWFDGKTEQWRVMLDRGDKA